MLGSISRMRAATFVRSEFVRQIAATFGTRVSVIGLGVVTSVLVARALGPDGRGTLAVAAALTGLAIQFGNLGLHASNTWAVARDPNLLPALAANSLIASAVIAGVEIGLIAVLVALVPELVPLAGILLLIALAGIPIGLVSLLLQNLLLGLQRVRDYNLLELAGRGISIVVMAGLIIAGLATATSFLLAGTVVSGFMAAVALFLVWRLASSRFSPRFDLLPAYAGFGLKAYTTALISFLVIRFDIFLVEAFRGVTDVGQYSIAVASADLVYSLPVVIGTLLFPRLSKMESRIERILYARDVSVRVGVLMLLAAVMVGILADPLIRVLYGESFVPAIAAFLWLLPGIVALSVHTILMNYCAAVGMPVVVVVAPAFGLLVNVGGNLILLPELGIVGAALASSVAYGVMLTISAAYFTAEMRSIRATAVGAV